MNYEITSIKPGIKIHKVNTNTFKTNLISVFLTTKLNKEDMTKKALILAILRRGTNNIKTQKEISEKLEELYGADFDCGIEKIGDNHVLKFYIESLNEKFLYKPENILEQSLNILLDIVFNPLVENGKFKTEYFEIEKQNLKQLIEAKKDNKSTYAYTRCIEEVYKNNPYGAYKYGYVEDLEKINEEELYKYYLELIKNCKIDIFVSGELENVQLKEIIEKNEIIKKINPREEIKTQDKEEKEEIKIKEVIEKMDIAQGKLVIGMKITDANKENMPVYMVYNAILGGGANSKMFQNVREKAGLAYTAGSGYIKSKNSIFIRCGIEHKNYEKAVKIIKEQIDDMQKGNFSQEDINHAKELLVSANKSTLDEQDSQIMYYYTNELAKETTSIEENIEKIQNVGKEQIVSLAKNIKIDTIYFLTK